MNKKLINEVKRFQKIAGIIKEMRVDSSGNLISDREYVEKAVWGKATSLYKALTALHNRPDYQRAKDFLKKWLQEMAQELGIDPIPSFDDPQFYQGDQPTDVKNYIVDTFVRMLESQDPGDEGELTEDDYSVPDDARSGDTALMGNINEDDLDLSDTPKFGGVSIEDVRDSPTYTFIEDGSDWGYMGFGVADLRGRCYLDFDPSGENEDEEGDAELRRLKKGWTTSKFVEAAIEKGFVQKDEDGYLWVVDGGYQLWEWISTIED